MRSLTAIALAASLFMGCMLTGCERPSEKSAEKPSAPANSDAATGPKRVAVVNLPPEAESWDNAERAKWIAERLNSGASSNVAASQDSVAWQTLEATLKWFHRHWDAVAAQFAGMGLGVVVQYAVGSIGVAVAGTAIAVPTFVICAIGGTIVGGYLYVYDLGSQKYEPGP